MKKLSIVIGVLIIIIFQNCSSTKKIQPAQSISKVSYTSNVQPLIAGNCSPCHMPPDGNKKALNSYIAVKGEIDEILSRVQKSPDEKGFMPFKHPKLSDSTIQVLVQWKSDGLLEN